MGSKVRPLVALLFGVIQYVHGDGNHATGGGETHQTNLDSDLLYDDASMNEVTVYVNADHMCDFRLLPPVELVRYDNCYKLHADDANKKGKVFHGDSCYYTCITAPDINWPDNGVGLTGTLREEPWGDARDAGFTDWHIFTTGGIKLDPGNPDPVLSQVETAAGDGPYNIFDYQIRLKTEEGFGEQMQVTCNCTNDIGVVDTRSVCRWEFSEQPRCAELTQADLSAQITTTAEYLSTKQVEISEFFDQLFETHVQGPFDAHFALIDPKLTEMEDWEYNEAIRREQGDAAIATLINQWDSGLLDHPDANWDELLTLSITLMDELHERTENLTATRLVLQDQVLIEHLAWIRSKDSEESSGALDTLETDLRAAISGTIGGVKTNIENDVADQWRDIGEQQLQLIANFKTASDDLIASYGTRIDQSVQFTDADLAALYKAVDDKKEALTTELKDLITGAAGVEAGIDAKIDSFRQLVQQNANGGLSDEAAAELIAEITTALNLAVHDVTSHLQDSIDEDFVAAATNTNDQVSLLRSEMSAKTVAWKDTIEAENARERESNIWISSFYAQDSWDNLESKILQDVDEFSAECANAVSTFESDMLEEMESINKDTIETVDEAKSEFNATLHSRMSEIEDAIDQMVLDTMTLVNATIAEMATKLDTQYATLESAITAADDEIRQSLADGLTQLEAEFADADNIAAIEALKAIGLQDFASLKEEQTYVAPHHHHLHTNDHLHTGANAHNLHEHEGYHPSFGPHHVHLNEPHHLYTSEFMNDLDDSLKQGWPDQMWPVWNGTAWNFETVNLDADASGAADHPDNYHPHKHDSDSPWHGPHPLHPDHGIVSGNPATNSDDGDLTVIEPGADGSYELHRHPAEPKKVLIAKMTFELETDHHFNNLIANPKTQQYLRLAEKYSELFDADFETVAEEFTMEMTGFYVRFLNETAVEGSRLNRHQINHNQELENLIITSSHDHSHGRKRREDFHYPFEDHALAEIVVYFEKVLPAEAPVYEEWYRKWLAVKLSEHAKYILSISDGTLSTSAHAPKVAVDTFVKIVTPEPGVEHFGFNPGPHTHADDDVKHGPDGVYKPLQDYEHLPSLGDKCLQERSRALLEGNVYAFIPTCTSTGHFRPEQCWRASGFCWCVDIFGKKLSGTDRKGWGKCPPHSANDHQDLLLEDHEHGVGGDKTLTELYHQIFAELHETPHHHHGDEGKGMDFSDFFNQNHYGHVHANPDDHPGPHHGNDAGVMPWYPDDDTMTAVHDDLHDKINSHGTNVWTKKIVMKAQFSVPLVIDWTVALTNENSARFMLYSIRMAKIFGFGFRQIGAQLHLKFTNMQVQFSQTGMHLNETESATSRKRRAGNEAANHAHAIISVFYEKVLHKDEDLTTDEIKMHKNWLENMVSISAHRSAHEFGDDLIADISMPVVDGTCEVKYLVPYADQVNEKENHDNDHGHDHADDHDADDHDDDYEDHGDINLIPYYEEAKYLKMLNAKAIFDVPTKRIFTMDLLNKNNPRYIREAGKLKNIFLPFMQNVAEGINMRFDGLTIDFFDKNDLNHDHHDHHRRKRAINYAWAEINAYYKTKVSYDEQIDADAWAETVEAAVVPAARAAIKGANWFVVRVSHVPVVNVMIDTEYLPPTDADVHHDHGVETDDHDHYGGKADKHHFKDQHANAAGHDPHKCLKEKEHAKNKNLVGQFVPQCNAAGGYLEMQCWASTGYCWCVNIAGERIQGTARRSSAIDCKAYSRNSLLDGAHFDKDGQLVSDDHSKTHHHGAPNKENAYDAQWMQQGYDMDKYWQGQDRTNLGYYEEYGPGKNNGIRTCSKCERNSDCGDWGHYYMECQAGFCICSDDWVDSDGDIWTGCETKKYGARMSSADCEGKEEHGMGWHSKEEPASIGGNPGGDDHGHGHGHSHDHGDGSGKTYKKCASCETNQDCGTWGTYYMECRSNKCLCSDDWADADNDWYNGCERKVFGIHMSANQCPDEDDKGSDNGYGSDNKEYGDSNGYGDKPSVAGYQGADKNWYSNGPKPGQPDKPGQYAANDQPSYAGYHERPAEEGDGYRYNADGDLEKPADKPGYHGHAHMSNKPHGYDKVQHHKPSGRWNSDGDWVEYWADKPDRITHGYSGGFGHDENGKVEGHAYNTHHHHTEKAEHGHQNVHDVTDGYDAIKSQMHHNLFSHLHPAGSAHYPQDWKGSNAPKDPAYNTYETKQKPHYHADDHDADSHGSHNWQDLSYGVASHGPHSHKGDENDNDPYFNMNDHNMDHHGSSHSPAHGDDKYPHHEHDKQEHKASVCGNCAARDDCGAWNNMHMDCDHGRCVCSRNFADFDGNRANGCEALSYGASMIAEDCPPLPTPKPSIRKCGKCTSNFDCGKWSDFYMECNKGYCVCSKHWADIDGDVYNGCERLQYTSNMQPEECGVVRPDEPDEVKQIMTTVEFEVETTFEYSDSLTIEKQPAYTSAAQAVGNVFVADLKEADEDWNLASVEIEFFDADGFNLPGRKRRQTGEKNLASARITATYEMAAAVDVPQTSVDIDVATLQRRVQYRARRGILLSQGDIPIIPKAVLFANADAPEVSVKGTTTVTLPENSYKPVTDPILPFLPPPPPPTERPPPSDGENQPQSEPGFVVTAPQPPIDGEKDDEKAGEKEGQKDGPPKSEGPPKNSGFDDFMKEDKPAGNYYQGYYNG